MTEISRLQATQPLNNQPIVPEQPEPKVSFKGEPDSFEKSPSNADVAIAATAGAAAGAVGANPILDKLFKFTSGFSLDKLKNLDSGEKKEIKDKLSYFTNKKISEERTKLEESVKTNEPVVNAKKEALDAAKKDIDAEKLKAFEDAIETSQKADKAHEIANIELNEANLKNTSTETMTALEKTVEAAEKSVLEAKTKLNEAANAIDINKRAVYIEAKAALKEAEVPANLLKELEVKVPAKYRAIAALAGAAIVGGVYAIGKLFVGSTKTKAE
ncbi:MAG: hypothetical protein PHC34_10230 [Candidatus Gastranaerophilales bacterium]|nr:hypothetical protein [Candidatus Gastranaerophilales bacterium]